MKTFKSNDNPFLKVDPFKEKKDKENIEKLMNIFKNEIKHKNIKELMDIQILLNKRLKELT